MGIIGATPVRSQFTPWGVNQSNAEDLQISLATIDPGEDLTTWWGHTGVIVEDTYLNISLFYNYGLFSFEQKNFVTNFVRGRLIFWVGAWRTSAALDFYKENNRSIRIQLLNLSPQKRLEMAEFLANNVLPENREYLYDHYYDNCATRIRDLIDKIVIGQFERATDMKSEMTLRQLTRCHTHHNFFMDWILMFLMNDSIDKPIRIWDDMFLPTEMEKNLNAFRYSDENGEEQAFISKSYSFYEASGQRIIPEEAPAHWPLTLFIGLLMSFVVLIQVYLIRSGKKSARLIFGLYQTLIGVLFGVLGLALFLISIFTDHVVTYYNENLFLANPLTILLIPLGLGFFRHKKFSNKWLPVLNYVLAGLCLLSLLLKLIPVFDQDNWLIISLILPIMCSLAISWYFMKK
jgi:hypothetical protein